MRKHESNGKPMRPDTVLKPSSSIIPAARRGNANVFTAELDRAGERIDVGIALAKRRVGSSTAGHTRSSSGTTAHHGPRRLERKLIFVALVLIHAVQLQGDIPAPKPYRAGSTQDPAGVVTS
jgi:hypothetical protein